MDQPSCSASTTQEKNVKKGDLILGYNYLQNKLIASGHSLDISLPRIIAIGCQSAGKSSVLERFVQKEFLPRGSNQVTRRPIIIQLIPSSEEYGIFLHREDKFTDFNAIREEIIRVTDEECKPQEFSKNPISLTIYSPKVLKLTIVDLPGIIKVPTGVQTDKTVEMVREIVEQYIKDPKSIILAVTPVSQEISNSDALEFAKSVDPEGERTIGVLTKIDRLEEGTDARDILENNLLPLKRGWVGVINRDNKETAEGKDMDYILKKESNYFKENPLYSHMAHRMGVPYLQRLLHKTLKHHIKKYLPDLRRDISQKLFKLEKDIKEYDKIMEDGGNVKQNHMTDLIKMFCDDITVKIMGYSEKVPTNTLTHGALMNFKLHNEVQRIISQVLLPDENEIINLIPNINGLRNSISIPSLVVDSSCQRLIHRFKEPLYSSVDCIKRSLLDAVEESGEILSSYPTLKNELLYRIQSWVEKDSEDTKDRLKEHIDAEMFFINTGHPDFDSSTCDPIAPPTGPAKIWCSNKVKGEESKNTDDDDDIEESGSVYNEVNDLIELLRHNPIMQKQVKYVTALVIKYLEIVRKQIADIAVKYIAYFVVKKVLYSINHNLIKAVFDSSEILSLCEDSADDIAKREELKMSCTYLKEALDAIRSF